MMFSLRSLPFLSVLFLTSALPAAAQDDKVPFDSKELDAQVAAATRVKLFEPAPDFTCRTTDGREFKLSAHRGKIVVLYFFATSVPSSLREMMEIDQEIVRKLRDRDDFAILGIGRGHTREEVVKAGGENKVTFPLASDPDKQCYGLYFSRYVPRIVVVRKDGQIAHLASGHNEMKGIEKLQVVLKRELELR